MLVNITLLKFLEFIASKQPSTVLFLKHFVSIQLEVYSFIAIVLNTDGDLKNKQKNNSTNLKADRQDKQHLQYTKDHSNKYFQQKLSMQILATKASYFPQNSNTRSIAEDVGLFLLFAERNLSRRGMMEAAITNCECQ